MFSCSEQFIKTKSNPLLLKDKQFWKEKTMKMIWSKLFYYFRSKLSWLKSHLYTCYLERPKINIKKLPKRKDDSYFQAQQWSSGFCTCYDITVSPKLSSTPANLLPIPLCWLKFRLCFQNFLTKAWRWRLSFCSLHRFLIRILPIIHWASDYAQTNGGKDSSWFGCPHRDSDYAFIDSLF